jgi:hypothetical protein
VLKVNPNKPNNKKKPAKLKKTSDSDEDEEDNEEDDKPHEKVRLSDGACIINYEVNVEEEEEEIVYAGGIKGIRALRKQRDVF